MGIRLKVEERKYDPSALALQIAQHIHNAALFRKQSEEFAKQALREDERVKELQELLEECRK
jgi:hypothetical protein